MAVLKCKICGGDLEFIQGNSLCECESCGTQQTVPTSDDKKIIAIFDRANELRNKCLFDEARSKFESVIEVLPDDAEAYWGMFLCDYGIEYVEDPGTGKMIPTCHRSSFDCVADNIDYNSAIEHASDEARAMYIKEAKHIEELRNGINVIANKEDPYDIFICYKETDDDGERTEDSVIAQDIYTALEKEGYRVFFSKITLEDHVGEEYEPYIFRALTTAKIMLLVCANARYYNAPWVKNEWKRFLAMKASQGADKYLFPCYKNIDPYEMPREIRSLQGQDMGRIGATQDLVRNIEKILGKKKKETSSASPFGSRIENTLFLGNEALKDGNFPEAKKHFNDVLSMNAKCGEAYVGLLLVNNKKSTLNEYLQSVKQAFLVKVEPELYNLFDFDSQIADYYDYTFKMADHFKVDNYLSYDSILDMYAYDLSFYSSVNGYKDLLDKLSNLRITPDNRKAYDFSDASVKKQFDSVYDGIFHSLNSKYEEESASINNLINQKKMVYVRFVQATDIRVKHDSATAKSRSNYDKYSEIVSDAQENAKSSIGKASANIKNLHKGRVGSTLYKIFVGLYGLSILYMLVMSIINPDNSFAYYDTFMMLAYVSLGITYGIPYVLIVFFTLFVSFKLALFCLIGIPILLGFLASLGGTITDSSMGSMIVPMIIPLIIFIVAVVRIVKNSKKKDLKSNKNAIGKSEKTLNRLASAKQHLDYEYNRYLSMHENNPNSDMVFVLDDFEQ